MLIGASLSGLGLILAASEAVFYIIKWLGTCYLIYLGISLIRARRSFADGGRASRPATPPSELYLFGQGLWIVVINPKALMFFAAFPPQFYVPQHGLVPQFLVMAGTFVGIEVVVEVLLGTLILLKFPTSSRTQLVVPAAMEHWADVPTSATWKFNYRHPPCHLCQQARCTRHEW